MLEERNEGGTTTGLCDRWRSQDETMPEALFSRFSEPVCRLAERLLDDRLKRKMDGEDIAQSVFRTLFRRAARGEYEFQHTGALWRMLIKITNSKVHYWARYYRTGRRDIGREIEADSEFMDGHGGQRNSVADRQFAEELAEIVDFVVSRLDERDAEVFFAWYYEQAPTVEIAERFCCSVATVNRVLGRIRERIRQLLQKRND